MQLGGTSLEIGICFDVGTSFEVSTHFEVGSYKVRSHKNGRNSLPVHRIDLEQKIKCFKLSGGPRFEVGTIFEDGTSIDTVMFSDTN